MPRRRRRSTMGSIEQRGSKYRIVWRDERKRKRAESGFDTFAEADARLLDIQQGSKMDSSMRWSRYWDVYARPTMDGLAPKTVAGYEYLWRSLLEPKMGGMAINKTDWRAVQSVMDDMRSTPSQQRHAFALVRKLCNMAVRDGLMQRNPANRDIRLEAVVKRRKGDVSVNAALDVISAARESKYEPIVLLCMCMGLRVEEACALDWEDFDFSDGMCLASISRTAVSINGTLVEQGRTKTASSDRTAVSTGWIAERLAELADHGPLVPNGRGGRTSPGTISHNWRAWCLRNDVPYVSLGNMRSWFATLACECCDSSLVSLSMGHTDGTTRGRNYQQSTVAGMRIVADAYSRYVCPQIVPS